MHRHRIGGAATIVVLSLLVLTLATARGRDARLYPPKAGETVTVYVVDNGWHSDIAVATAAIEAQGGALGHAARETSPSPWTLIGWGDARFYEAPTPAVSRLPDGLAALMGG